jgi:hypothetical protein
MDIKLPHPNSKDFPSPKRLAFTPKAREAKSPKPARLQGFSTLSLGQYWPGHWSGQPGTNQTRPGPSFPHSSGPLRAPVLRPTEAPLPVKLGEPLGIDDVAALIGCSPWTVRQTLIPRGLPFFRSGASGRLIFYSDQIVRWIESQQQGGITTK